MSANASNMSSALNVSGSSSTNLPMVVSEKDRESLWYFSAEQLANSPSRRHGIDIDQELSYRQMTAYLIQEMGQRLQVSQLCINTAIVYMHRFYAFHSFTHFHRNGIAAASLFLAAKVEEQPRKLEHVIKAANKCLNQPTSSTTDAYYLEQAQDLVFNENVLLQTLGFDVAIDHPHTHVVKTCHLVKACKDLAQTSYFLASNSLHLTSMCLQYKPTVVACFCIYLACKWSRWEIPQSTEGKHWFHYVDKTVTMDLLKQLTDEFIAIYEKSPARLKSKLNSIKALAQGASNRVVNKDKKSNPEEWKMVDMMKMYHSSINTSEVSNANAPANSFPTSTTLEQTQQQSGQSALLPPPHTHQQVRRPDSYASQHRSSSHSSTSHHHSKQTFSTNDAPDHKSSSHKTQHYNSSSNRPREHSQPSQNMTILPIIPTSSSSGSRSSLPIINSNNSSRPPMPVGVSSQKLLTQAHDPNFHKSRDRNTVPAPVNVSGTIPQPHKLSQKPDAGRMVSKEHNGRITDPMKSNSKVFVPGNVAQIGNPQLLSGGELPRNILQQQRLHPPGYHQSSISRTSNNNNSKHDQSISVQMQQPQHKNSVELQYNSVPSDQLQPQSIHSNASSYTNPRVSDTTQCGDQTDTDSPQTYSSYLQMSGMKPQQQSKLSMFSPEWNDKVQQSQQMPSGSISKTNAISSTVNMRMSSSLGSPKRTERERSSGTPTKKDRSRPPYPGMDVSHQTSTTSRQMTQVQSTQKLQNQKKSDIGNNLNVLAGTSAYTGLKRPSENPQIKQEEDLSRDSKMRKLDNSAMNCIGQPISEMRNVVDTNKLQVVNGIETNPELVRTLLKESLCTSNALLKSEPSQMSSFYPPAQLLDPGSTSIKEEKVTTSAIPTSMDIDETIGSKSEKKKKKDKHKHKEKDKNKDRDERKKHKKDKERHKDRESDTSEPVKLKISKEKLESTGVSSEPLGFKIKIPKERIIADLNSSGNNSNYGAVSSDMSNAGNASAPPALKIKISKDKLEHYSSGSSDTANTSSISLNNQSSSNIPQSNVVFNSSSKKKDRERDRDREKEKKRASLDYVKSSSTNVQNGTAATGTSFIQSSSSSKSTSSSKIQHYSNNMSQLFGESNDDEDDDDRTYQRPKKTSLPKSICSASSSTHNYHIPSKQNVEIGGNSEGSFNLQHNHQQQYNTQQRSIYQKK